MKQIFGADPNKAPVLKTCNATGGSSAAHAKVFSDLDKAAVVLQRNEPALKKIAHCSLVESRKPRSP